MSLSLKLQAISILAILTAFASVANPLTTYADPPPMPPTSISYYMGTVSTSAAYDAGCAQAEADLLSGTTGSTVILAFGAQQDDYGGTKLAFGTGSYVSNTQIEGAAVQFAAGWWACMEDEQNPNDAGLALGVGTSNSDYDDGMSVVSAVNTGGGEAWASLILDISNDIFNLGYDHVFISGASDMEPNEEFHDGPPDDTRDWVDGFTATACGGSCAVYVQDFGSADGCSEDEDDNLTECDNGWYQDDVYYVSFGCAACGPPVPSIYATGLASQWAMIASWGNQTYSAGYYFAGPLSDYARDSSDLTPAQAYDALWTATHGITGLDLGSTTDITVLTP